MVFINLCILVRWTKVAFALEGLTDHDVWSDLTWYIDLPISLASRSLMPVPAVLVASARDTLGSVTGSAPFFSFN